MGDMLLAEGDVDGTLVAKVLDVSETFWYGVNDGFLEPFESLYA